MAPPSPSDTLDNKDASSLELAGASQLQDEAQRVLAFAQDEPPPTEEECAQVVRKVDWVLMPILWVTGGLQYCDKSALSVGALFGMIRDLKLYQFDSNGTIDTFLYSQCAMIFFVGYACGAFPLGAIAQRLPTAKVCAVYCLIWGIVVTVTPACTSFSGLMAQRFFLGFVESGVSPAFLSIIGAWYTKKEAAMRTTILFSANGFVVIPLLLLAWGAVTIGPPEHSWKPLYYFIGGLTILWSAVIYFALPDSPVTAKFLSHRQRYVAVERLRSNQAGITSKIFKPTQAFSALLDPKVILLALITFCVASPGGAVGSFTPLVIQQVYGANPRKTLLLLMPTGVVGGIANLIAGYVTSRVPNTRCAVFAAFALVSLAGGVLQWKVPLAHKEGILAGCFIIPAYSACLGTMTGLVVSNTAGASRKTAVGSIMFMSNALSNIAAPFFFKKSELPRYPTGFLTTGALLAASVGLVGIYALLCSLENSRRDKATSEAVGDNELSDQAFSDLTDNENKVFRYTF